MSGSPVFAAITTVTFDAGGTLLRPYPSVGVVYREAARCHGGVLDAAAVESAFRRAFARVSKSSLLLDPEERERDFWRQVVAAALEEAAATLPDFDAFFADVWERFARGDCWRVLPGVATTLQTLRERGYRLAVLSNWDRRLHRVLAETGLRPWFDQIVISSEVGAEKPDVQIFRAAEQALEAAPRQCLHIGDSRRHDVAGARGAGWKALLVGSEHTAAEGEDGIAELTDALPFLPGPASQS